MRDLSEILRLRNDFIEKYVDFFKYRGYHPDRPAEFITQDNSVLFTNSTINLWKRYAYSEEIPNQGIFVNPKQPCLRLHVLSDKLTHTSVTETRSDRLLGYFNMLGILCEGEKSESLPLDVIDLLTDHYEIPEKNIAIFVSDENDFIGMLEGKIRIVRGEESKREYVWTYGSEYELIGDGAKIKLLQEDGKFCSIGQIIKINSPNKTTFEFGFGVETLLATLNSRKDYSSWTVYHCLPKEYRFKTLLDLVSCFGATSTINPQLMRSKHRKEVIRLARRIIRLENLLNIPSEILESSINRFISLEFDINSEKYVHDRLNHARLLEKNESIN